MKIRYPFELPQDHTFIREITKATIYILYESDLNLLYIVKSKQSSSIYFYLQGKSGLKYALRISDHPTLRRYKIAGPKWWDWGKWRAYYSRPKHWKVTLGRIAEYDIKKANKKAIGAC